jgi:hypothetical protein
MRRMDGGILCPLTSRKMRSMVVSLRGPMQHLQSRNGTPRRQGARNLTTNLENNRVAVGERATWTANSDLEWETKCFRSFPQKPCERASPSVAVLLVIVTISFFVLEF